MSNLDFDVEKIKNCPFCNENLISNNVDTIYCPNNSIDDVWFDINHQVREIAIYVGNYKIFLYYRINTTIIICKNPILVKRLNCLLISSLQDFNKNYILKKIKIVSVL